METKSSTSLAILDKCPTIITSSKNVGFSGAFPPSREQVLLNYHGYHKYLQDTTKRQSSGKDAVKLVIKDIKDWWNNLGISLKIDFMLEKLV